MNHALESMQKTGLKEPIKEDMSHEAIDHRIGSRRGVVVGMAVPVSAAQPVTAEGEFEAIIDFGTLTLTPVGANCLLEVSGTLIFTGTLEGGAPAKTSALVAAPCNAVGNNPPGAFPDVFKSELEFTGTVNGEPVTSDITYQGITQVGGGIEAKMILPNGLSGTLDVDAIVAVGGPYTGSIHTH